MGITRAHVDALFRVQAGVASARQLEVLKVTPGQIARRRRTGEWQRVRPGVLRVTAVPPSWESNLIASVLLVGEGGVVSHATAARFHGLRGYGSATSMDLTVAQGRTVRASGQTVHHTRRLERIDVVTHDRRVEVDEALKDVGVVTEFRMTSPARTIIDLAARVSATELGNLIDDAASRGLATPDFVQRRLDDLRASGLTGVRKLSEAMLDAGGHSWLERRFLRLVREAGFPKPRTQVVFRRDGTTVARVDFLFDGTRVIVEVSGRRGHSSDADRAKDARRRNELQRQGYVVIEFVTTQVIDDPAYVLGTLRRHLPPTLAA